MKIKNIYGEVFEVKVGDYVGFKKDHENSGKIIGISNGKYEKMFKIDTEDGIELVSMNRVWPE